jgi:hypothetical protein
MRSQAIQLPFSTRLTDRFATWIDVLPLDLDLADMRLPISNIVAHCWFHVMVSTPVVNSVYFKIMVSIIFGPEKA